MIEEQEMRSGVTTRKRTLVGAIILDKKAVSDQKIVRSVLAKKIA